jgi:hypothetical protein
MSSLIAPTPPNQNSSLQLTKHNWALETKFKEMGIKETTGVGVEKEEEIRPDVEQQKDADFVTETNTKENDST